MRKSIILRISFVLATLIFLGQACTNSNLGLNSKSGQGHILSSSGGGACPSSSNYTDPSNPIGAPVTLASLGVINCYYVAANGLDSNSGTSESSPWLHSPGMQQCSGNCAAVHLAAGMGIIFRGGDTWHFGNPNASPYTGIVTNCSVNGSIPAGLCLNGINLNGSSRIYLGADQAWSASGSWARPIFTGDNPPCNANTVNGTTCFAKTDIYGQASYYVSSCSYQIGTSNLLIDAGFSKYIALDNLELTGLCQRGGQNGGDTYVRYGDAQAPEYFTNLYIHGSSHSEYWGTNTECGHGTANVSGTTVTWASENPVTDCTTSQFGASWAFINLNGTTYPVASYNSSTSLTLASSAGSLIGATYYGGCAPNPYAVCVDMSTFKGGVGEGNSNVGETIALNVVDYSDSDPASMGLCFGGFYNVAYNVFRYTTNCVSNPLHTFHDNLYEYFFESGHSNLLEDVGESPGAANAIYNNVFRHIEANIKSGGGVGLWPAPPTSTTTDYIFNNVMYDVGNLEYLNIGGTAGNNALGNYTFFNNTFQSNYADPILRCESYSNGAVTDINNHYIDDQGYILGPCSTLTSTTPLLMTNAVATSDGYLSSQGYAYSPTSSRSPTVGAGTNKSSFCSALLTAAQSDPTLSDAATACQSDTRYACTYNLTNHTVSCPSRKANSRSPAGAWDIGAYQYSSVGPTPTPSPSPTPAPSPTPSPTPKPTPSPMPSPSPSPTPSSGPTTTIISPKNGDVVP